MADAAHAYDLQLKATEAGLDQLAAVGFEMDEGLSRPFVLALTARTLDPTDPSSLDPGLWLRKKVAVCLTRNDQETWTHGVILAVEHLGEDGKDLQFYRLEIGPSLALLQHTRRTRVFVDQKPLDVVRAVLQEGGVQQIDLKAAGAAGQKMRHITQFEESDLAFVSRLLEQEGAAYWFTHTSSGHTMVIGDAVSHHPGSASAIKATYSPTAESIGSGLGIINEMSLRFDVVSMYAAVRDYSESHPKSAAAGTKTLTSTNAPGATGKHGEGDYHVTLSDGDATAYTNRLADRMMNRCARVVGSGDILTFRAGMRMVVSGKEGFTEHALLTDVKHTCRNGAYNNKFSAIPASKLPWRPLRTTPIPRIDGVVPGIVTATAGDQGGGEDGSYRVKLLNGDDAKDRIVRMAQPYAGPAQGFHFPLPVNTEVLLAHEYGHPDRPIIAGAMHNTEDPSPVLEANKTQCVVRSAAGAVLIFEDKKDEEKTTIQSKGLAKLEMDDKPDAEKVTLQSKGEAKLILDDKAGEGKITLQSKAGHTLVFADKDGEEDMLLKTKGGQKIEFVDKGGSEQLHIVANKDHKQEIGGKSDTTVKEAMTVTCKDTLTIEATTEIVLKVGGNSITISSSGITIKGSDVTITATGAMALEGSTGVTAKSSADVKLDGLNVSLSAKIGATVKGNATAELSASGQTTVKGGIVMIN